MRQASQNKVAEAHLNGATEGGDRRRLEKSLAPSATGTVFIIARLQSWRNFNQFHNTVYKAEGLNLIK